MNTIHRYLLKSDKDDLLEFSKKVNHTRELSEWLQKTVTDESRYSVICAEFIDGKMNAIIAACSWSYWVGLSNEHQPMWLGIRTDRIESADPFNNFMDKLSTLITMHFESISYFQHYIVRKLPKKFTTTSDIARFTKRSWGQGPYTTTVEYIIDSEDAYKTAPALFKSMVGPYLTPVVVLFMNITDNLVREQRKNAACNNS